MNTEIVWAAGFFDGEGSAGVQKRDPTRKPYMRLTVTQKDPRPLRRFQEAVGAGRIYGPYPPRGVHKWIASPKAALLVVELLWPYLSEPKREQISRTKEALGIG